jgi:hypothetical protein
MVSIIRAKYNGKCCDCHEPIEAGDLFAWQTGGERKTRCLSCEDARRQRPMFMAFADRRERDDYRRMSTDDARSALKAMRERAARDAGIAIVSAVA